MLNFAHRRLGSSLLRLPGIKGVGAWFSTSTFQIDGVLCPLRRLPNTPDQHRYVSRDPAWTEDHYVERAEPTVWARDTRSGREPRCREGVVPVDEPIFEKGSNLEVKFALALEHYRTYGFAVVPGVFGADEVSQFRASVDDHLATLSAEDPRVVLEPQSTSESPCVRSVFEVHKTTFHGLSGDARILAFVQHLLADDVYVHQSRVNFQRAHHGTGFGWHSDAETWMLEDGMPSLRALSAVVMLTDNTETNGSLMVIPKSHRTFVGCVGTTPEDAAWEESLRDSLYFGTPSPASRERLALDTGCGVYTCAAPAGSLLLFDSNLLHASSGNMSPFDRTNLFFAYSAVSNRIQDAVYVAKGRPEYLATRDPKFRGIPLKPPACGPGSVGGGVVSRMPRIGGDDGTGRASSVTMSATVALAAASTAAATGAWQEEVDGVTLAKPVLRDAAAMHKIVVEGTLDTNSAYMYMLFSTHFAGTSVIARDSETGQPLGFVAAYVLPEKPDAVFIWQVGVATDARGRGVGSKMLDAVARHAPAGVKFMHATVTPSNAASIALFRSFASRRNVPIQVAREKVFPADAFPANGGSPHEKEDYYVIGAWV